jgi:hypothetical protein
VEASNDAGGAARAPEAGAWRRLSDEAKRTWARALAGAGSVIVDRGSEAISVSGPCPECGHDFQVTLTEKDILASLAGDDTRSILKGPQGRVDWRDLIRFEAFCYCTTGHEGRPSNITHGCGAAGFLRDTPDS